MGRRMGDRVIDKAANGEGSVYQRKDGRWVAAVTAPDGSRVAFYGKTQAEAKRKRKVALTRLEKGLPVVDSKATVRDFLTAWIAEDGGLEAEDRAEQTLALYRTICKTHLMESALGDVRLDQLLPSHIEKALISLKRKGLSGSYRRNTYAVLKAALDSAVADRLIAYNPVLLVKRPPANSKPSRALTVEELNALLQAAEGSRYHDLVAFIFATGVRKSEALDTTWDHLDLEVGLYRVPGTKTASSKATLPLSPGLVALLDLRRDLQAMERKEAGDQWHELGLVFTTEFGTRVDGRNVLRVVKTAAKKAGIKDFKEVNVHSLRHSAGTYLEESSVPLKTTSTILRHADIQTTANVYLHPSIESMRPAVNLLSEAIGL